MSAISAFLVGDESSDDESEFRVNDTTMSFHKFDTSTHVLLEWVLAWSDESTRLYVPDDLLQHDPIHVETVGDGYWVEVFGNGCVYLYIREPAEFPANVVTVDEILDLSFHSYHTHSLGQFFTPELLAIFDIWIVFFEEELEWPSNLVFLLFDTLRIRDVVPSEKLLAFHSMFTGLERISLPAP